MSNQSSNQEVIVFGFHPVGQILQAHPKLVKRVLVKDTVSTKHSEVIITYAKKFGITASKVPDKEIKKFAGDVVHQGFVAILHKFPYTPVEDLLSSLKEKERSLIVVLDEIEDPHNLGAIIRSASAAGADAVVFGEHRQAKITGTVMKTSAGTAVNIPVVEVKNIKSFFEDLKKNGFWVFGLDAGEGAVSIWKSELAPKAVIVVGNEGNGMRSSTRTNCDEIISIPMSDEVESLNASVSAGIAIFDWKRRFDA